MSELNEIYPTISDKVVIKNEYQYIANHRQIYTGMRCKHGRIKTENRIIY